VASCASDLPGQRRGNEDKWQPGLPGRTGMLQALGGRAELVEGVEKALERSPLRAAARRSRGGFEARGDGVDVTVQVVPQWRRPGPCAVRCHRYQTIPRREASAGGSFGPFGGG